MGIYVNVDVDAGEGTSTSPLLVKFTLVDPTGIESFDMPYVHEVVFMAPFHVGKVGKAWRVLGANGKSPWYTSYQPYLNSYTAQRLKDVFNEVSSTVLMFDLSMEVRVFFMWREEDIRVYRQNRQAIAERNRV